MDDKTSHTSPQSVETSNPPATRMSRRSMLSRASKVAIPVVVTLYSGTSSGTGTAISSNLISVDSTPGPENNVYSCLDKSSVFQVPNKPNVYDLGSDPMAHVTRIEDKRWFRPGYNGPNTNQEVSEKTVCNEGGNFYKKSYNNSYTKKNVKKGVLCSATALSSFSKKITYSDV